MELDVPTQFSTIRGEEGATHPIAVRHDLDAATAEALLAQVAAVDWDAVHHAYGPASDVPGQLAAVIVGDEATRDEAWWNLWGNIHHQGTVYEATVPAVPILVRLARWREHPDRAQALLMLREVRAASGADVGLAPLLDGWRDEPAEVQRALLWLLSADPDLRADHEDLVEAVLPEQHRRGWDLEVGGAIDSQEEADAAFALEEWIHTGVL